MVCVARAEERGVGDVEGGDFSYAKPFGNGHDRGVRIAGALAAVHVGIAVQQLGDAPETSWCDLDLGTEASRSLRGVATPENARAPPRQPLPPRPAAAERRDRRPGCHGWAPCIRGLRIPVAIVVAMVADGMATAEIVEDLPDLTPDDIAEALRFATSTVRERELPLRQSA